MMLSYLGLKAIQVRASRYSYYFKIVLCYLIWFIYKAPEEYPNWMEDQNTERKINVKIIQLHEKEINYYNMIRAEGFIDTLQDLWESNSKEHVRLDTHIQPDWLNFALKLCRDKLPSKLPEINNLKLNILSYSLYKVDSF
jgi:hypothetical protein